MKKKLLIPKMITDFQKYLYAGNHRFTISVEIIKNIDKEKYSFDKNSTEKKTTDKSPRKKATFSGAGQ